MAQPLQKFRAGQVTCAIWENEMPLPNGGSKEVLKATVGKSYKDRNGEWKNSSSFSRNEIPLAEWCLDRAFSAMLEEQDSEREGVEQEQIE